MYNYRYEYCAKSFFTTDYASCEGADTITRGSCIDSSLEKSTRKYYKFTSSIEGNVTFSLHNLPFPSCCGWVYATPKCVFAYKENLRVDTDSSASYIEEGQNEKSCETSATVSTSENSFRCVSILSACTGDYLFRVADGGRSERDTISGSYDSTLPTWSSENGIYTEIEGKVLPLIGDEQYTLISIGFPFTFFGRTYNDLYITASGFVSFEDQGLTSKRNSKIKFSDYLFLDDSSSPVQMIAPWLSRLKVDCSSDVQYITTTENNKNVFIVQWKNVYAYYGGSYISDHNTGDLRLNFQIKLVEGTNEIQFIYGNTSGTKTGSSTLASIGIKHFGGSRGYMDGTTGSSSGKHYYDPTTEFPTSGTIYKFTP
ncbi:MAG: hypothetical protein H7A23_04500 [Leptospiraceae bacterium]|nr:hypothetical protein [Leptospiraceae bacterium]MCP5493794.1 hypothetical protein [Leptospiraceae bacterium]